MANRKRSKKKKIRKEIRKKIPKIKLKKKKDPIISKEKNKLKGMVYFNRSLRLLKILKRNKRLKVLNMTSLKGRKEKDKLTKNKKD